MTQSLLLKLKAPLQAWGADSRYRYRQTHHVPTKSGILGLISAAEGRRRVDSVEDLIDLEFGVRVDQQGTILRDYQTAIDWKKRDAGRKSDPMLSERFYLADAHFLAAISGPQATLEGIRGALLSPTFPLYLGRRSCPAGPDLVAGIKAGDVETVLRTEPWGAAQWYRAKRPKVVHLPIYRDARPGEMVEERVRDVPKSFDPRRRDYDWRLVHAPDPVEIDNPAGKNHLEDPFWEAVMSV
ncbi:hypothetical protein GCM10009720_28270 [Yaniella flava]|uniref:Type I-E CRISPR-associated protein Cas5/CasD n=1 Tax=Yaniella flava TaxID=287930 RepID=A0ABN2UYT7_9MICC